MAEYKYRLAKWGERNKSLKCPQCGRARGCFKEYLLEDGTPVDPINHTCGLCDHTSSCGYHLPPKEYYKMNPEQRANYQPQPIDRPPLKRIEIDIAMANKSRSCYELNTFVRWVRSLPWNPEQRGRLEVALDFYNVGTTRDGGVLWWQIDEDMVVRTGKKLVYDATGHRLKDAQGNAIRCNWVHAMMRGCPATLKRVDDEPVTCKKCCAKFTVCPFPRDTHDIVQCLFGEHLLKVCPKAIVCVVESEKTAVLMSAYDSEAFRSHIWLATGGKYNLQEMKLYPLRKRNVLLYPDRDAVEDWRERIKDIPYSNLILYDKWITQLWQPEDGEKADIGDTILRLIGESLPTLEELMKDREWLRQLDEMIGVELVSVERKIDSE